MHWKTGWNLIMVYSIYFRAIFFSRDSFVRVPYWVKKLTKQTTRTGETNVQIKLLVKETQQLKKTEKTKASLICKILVKIFRFHL